MDPVNQNPLPEPNISDKVQSWVRTSVTVRLFAILVLVLLLLIPMGMIRNLINEREETRDEAIREVSTKFASDQFVAGPYLSVPYQVEYRDSKGVVYSTMKYLNFAPEELMVASNIDPLPKRRGIYEVVLYKSQNKLSGSFRIDMKGKAGLLPGNLEWDKAFISLRISDTRGIDNISGISINGKTFDFHPGVPVASGTERGIHAPLAISAADSSTLHFEMNLSLDGSSRLMFIPLGKTTTATMSSSWTNPSFDGTFVSDTNKVSDEGFTASWRILEFNRGFPEYWRDGEGDNPFDEELDGGLEHFGVNLLQSVDFYRKSMRTAKYAILVIVLTFTIFFLVEVLNRKRIHPVQYVLVGLALTLFYSLLLALAEFLAFDLAYLLASLGITGMITAYTFSIFHSPRLSILTGAVLVAVYGFIYIILQLNDMAFILGNLGLFVALGLVMYLTRKFDWYNMRREA